ncbi:MAG: BON domain-containing protein, partial [Elusimicrobia bacterium]|nr:BON domain-containing protein [Elusimicrobiota bacterium]
MMILLELGRMKKISAGIIAMAFLVWLSSCQTKTGYPDVPDVGIRSAIEADLLFDDAVPSHLIDVSVTDGIATLSGSVDNLLAKERAEKRAEIIRGVRSVVNNITVRSIRRNDEAIKKDVEYALTKNPAADALDIDVSVNDQMVK